MQRRSGAVEANIGDEFAALGQLIETREIGALMQKAALDEYAEKVGLGTKIACHGKPLCIKFATLDEGDDPVRFY